MANKLEEAREMINAVDAQMAELFAFYKGYSGLFKAMQEERLADMYDRLYKAQDADVDCNDYPRFKLRDDTCAVYGIFTP